MRCQAYENKPIKKRSYRSRFVKAALSRCESRPLSRSKAPFYTIKAALSHAKTCTYIYKKMRYSPPYRVGLRISHVSFALFKNCSKPTSAYLSLADNGLMTGQ